uniref:Uncharacterized protein n=1 Tax=Bicosoecida sp. CB-2014 TaxID=1486930 RepID=A0A7S1CHH2_9STRA|mmetsp:Transcript_2503/g.8534  ORF Transcript_2503/g.8534 Transcript_2503/m.8534 type:complete len:642 (+) Transcript_2503:289-2214(+)|eukprot:CAMPEP_0203815720 /NCGR_PEP_ID=MMETSP0115-20131106/11279_1 /ASSEMBLY_ACC=CAM_ASM_000227 /TAXON_ID=33651 /ORGANISM="Bicosoecid sp, Strain ms1" /LENGTH=641 /DNA_ID=CAMNT_0050724619 /DNA_START=285 /DNA_END=2210 /DNA_ORIENTATION=-
MSCRNGRRALAAERGPTARVSRRASAHAVAAVVVVVAVVCSRAVAGIAAGPSASTTEDTALPVTDDLHIHHHASHDWDKPNHLWWNIAPEAPPSYARAPSWTLDGRHTLTGADGVKQVDVIRVHGYSALVGTVAEGSRYQSGSYSNSATCRGTMVATDCSGYVVNPATNGGFTCFYSGKDPGRDPSDPSTCTAEQHCGVTIGTRAAVYGTTHAEQLKFGLTGWTTAEWQNRNAEVIASQTLVRGDWYVFGLIARSTDSAGAWANTALMNGVDVTVDGAAAHSTALNNAAIPEWGMSFGNQDIDVHEAVCYDRALSDYEVALVNAYMMSEVGLEANGPCSDGVQNYGETGVDCGGDNCCPCGGCPEGTPCTSNSECIGGCDLNGLCSDDAACGDVCCVGFLRDPILDTCIVDRLVMEWEAHADAGSCVKGSVPVATVKPLGSDAPDPSISMTLSLVDSTPPGLPLPFLVVGEDIVLRKAVDAGSYDFDVTGHDGRASMTIELTADVTCAGIASSSGTDSTLTLSVTLVGFSEEQFTSGTDPSFDADANIAALETAVARGLGIDAGDVAVQAAAATANGATVQLDALVPDDVLATDKVVTVAVDASAVASADLARRELAFEHVARVASRSVGVCCTATVELRV